LPEVSPDNKYWLSGEKSNDFISEALANTVLRHHAAVCCAVKQNTAIKKSQLCILASYYVINASILLSIANIPHFAFLLFLLFIHIIQNLHSNHPTLISLPSPHFHSYSPDSNFILVASFQTTAAYPFFFEKAIIFYLLGYFWLILSSFPTIYAWKVFFLLC
jgi:hypothetical protein